jgi:putative tryptophan/tyrosine transport system substrate-binding protein
VRRRNFIAFLASAAIAWPLGTRAQQPKPVIGVLGVAPPSAMASNMSGFRQGLSETGYIDGQNLAIDHRWVGSRYDLFPALAAEFVQRKVDLMFTGNLAAALVLKKATSTIPIVFLLGDPVADGVVASLARPGGNLTGISLMLTELLPKRLELLSELVPDASVITLLVNPNNAHAESIIGTAQEAARAKGVQLVILKAGTESEIDAAFDALVQRQAGALLVAHDSLFFSQTDRLVALASRHAVPAIYPWREYVGAGGLISYGASQPASYRQAGIYAGKILNGAKPADLPIQQAVTFELVLNLKTAKALGLAVPPSILARADEVIE